MDVSDIERQLLEALSRSAFQDPTWAKPRAIEPASVKLWDLGGVGLDTNVLKMYRREPLEAANLVELLRAKGVALIIPGQTVVEYWNNHKVFARDDWNQAINDLRKFNEKLSKLGALAIVQDRLDELQKLVDEVSRDLQESTSSDFLDKSTSVLETLLEYALQPMVSRAVFYRVALARIGSKTPPGFADASAKGNLSLGDFYCWCDFMFGALHVSSSLSTQKDFLFVTDDEKPDWKTGGSGHPYLLQEFSQVTGSRLAIATTKDLQGLLASGSGEEEQPSAGTASR